MLQIGRRLCDSQGLHSNFTQKKNELQLDVLFRVKLLNYNTK